MRAHASLRRLCAFRKAKEGFDNSVDTTKEARTEAFRTAKCRLIFEKSTPELKKFPRSINFSLKIFLN